MRAWYSGCFREAPGSFPALIMIQLRQGYEELFVHLVKQPRNSFQRRSAPSSEHMVGIVQHMVFIVPQLFFVLGQPRSQIGQRMDVQRAEEARADRARFPVSSRAASIAIRL